MPSNTTKELAMGVKMKIDYVMRGVVTVLLLCPVFSRAQWYAPTHVTVGEENTFTFYTPPGESYAGRAIRWSDSGFYQIVSGRGNPVTDLGAARATIKFIVTGNADVEIWIDDGPEASISVTAHPMKPSISSITPVCESGRVRMTMVYPDINNIGSHEFRWYDAPQGGNLVATGSTLERTISSTTNFYVSTYELGGGGESLERTLVTAPVTTNAVQPPGVVTPVHGIAGGQAILQASGASSGVSYVWRNSAGSLIGMTTANTINVPVPSVSTTGFVSVQLNDGVCEGPKAWISITVYPKPVLAGSGLAQGESATLSCSAGYDSYTWYLNGNQVYASSQNTYSTDIPGVYKVVVTKNGASGESNTFTVGTDQFDNQDENYVVTDNIQEKGVSTSAAIASLTRKGNMQAIQYFDGIGRPMQSVSTQGSPLGYDIILPVMYDLYGREPKKYLPVVTKTRDGWYKPDVIDNAGNYASLASVNMYNNGASDKVEDSSQPYAETTFEPSPLNRILRQGAPGASWQPTAEGTYDYDAAPPTDHSIKKAYVYNGPNEVILLDYNETTKRIGLGAMNYYVENRLYVNKTKDEQNHEVIEYIDKEGHTVLKKVETLEGNTKVFAETYYIYDDFGNLVTVLPPEATKQVKTIFNLQP
jgi:hypothetical protein